jgi:hypothetical protein
VAVEPAAAPIEIESVLTAVFGRNVLLAMFQFDDFSRRLTATVDNLGCAHAPARLWPVNPTPGRFSVQRQGEAEFVGADTHHAIRLS